MDQAPPPSPPAIHASAHAGSPSKGEAADPVGLRAIMENESSGGKNLNHSVVEHGPNKGHRAGGGYAVMPITFKDVVNKHSDLKAKYGHVAEKSPDEITSALNSDQGMAKDVATRHYNNLHRAFSGDHVKVAHAWLHGQTGTKNTPEEQIVSHPYVKDYLKNYAKESARTSKPKQAALPSPPIPDEPSPVAVSGGGGMSFVGLNKAEEDDFGGGDDDELEKIDRYTEDMTPHKGKSVFVYYNLHKKVWSVKHKGRVIAHTRNVTIDNAKFKVSEPGRQRVLKEKKKNVHAGVTGVVGEHHPNPDVSTGHAKVSYNPYHAGHFYETKQGPEGKSVPGDPIHGASRVHMLVHQKQGPAGAVNIPSVHAKKDEVAKTGPTKRENKGKKSSWEVASGHDPAYGLPDSVEEEDDAKRNMREVRLTQFPTHYDPLAGEVGNSLRSLGVPRTVGYRRKPVPMAGDSIKDKQDRHGVPQELDKSKSEDLIPGGLADQKNVKDFNPKSVKAGAKVEREHTSNPKMAREIAADHLTEDPKYYEKLKTIEKAKIDDVRAEKVRVGKPKWFPPRADGSLQVTPESIERDIRHMKESDRANRHERSGPENQVTGHPDLHGNIEVTQPHFQPAEPFTPVDPLLRPIGARKEQKRTSPYMGEGRGPRSLPGGRDMTDVGRGGVPAGSPAMLDKADILKAKIDDVRAARNRSWAEARSDHFSPSQVEALVESAKRSERGRRQHRVFAGGTSPQGRPNVEGHPDRHGAVSAALEERPVDPLRWRRPGRHFSVPRPNLTGGRDMLDVGRGGVPAGDPEMLDDVKKAKVDDIRYPDKPKTYEENRRPNYAQNVDKEYVQFDRRNRQARGNPAMNADMVAANTLGSTVHSERRRRTMALKKPNLPGGDSIKDKQDRHGVPQELEKVSSKEVLGKLQGEGFAISNVTGSHHKLRHPDGRSAVVPHPKKDLDRGIIGSIERQSGVVLNPKKVAKQQQRALVESRGASPEAVASVKDALTKVAMMKMAIADLRAGQLKHSDENYEHHDYSHVLSDAHRAAGYSLTVLQRKKDASITNAEDPHPLKAHIHVAMGSGAHGPKSKPQKVGFVGAEVHDTGHGLPGSSYSITPHSMINAPHRGKGLGVAAYEALYAHAKHKMNVVSVNGGNHTHAASQVHQSLARKHGLNYKPKHVPADAAEDRGPYSYALKSEEPMTKMAIRDIKPGKRNKQREAEVAPNEEDHETIPAKVFDYSHVLSPLHRKAGYSMEVSTHEDKYGDHSVYSTIHHKGKVVGNLRSEHGESRGKGELWVHDAQINKEHRGKGLGVAAYEATYAHAKHTAKLKTVHGGVHSSSAARVHQSLAEKHGLGYKVEKNPFTAANSSPVLAPAKKQGDYDQFHAPYSYALKSEEPMGKAKIDEVRHGKTGQDAPASDAAINGKRLDRAMRHFRTREGGVWSRKIVGHPESTGGGELAGILRHDALSQPPHPPSSRVGHARVLAGIRSLNPKLPGGDSIKDKQDRAAIPESIEKAKKLHHEIKAKVRAALTDDLRSKEYRGDKNPIAGHCYVAAEAAYHLLGGKESGWKPMHINHEGTHWFLHHEKHGVLDPTHDQFKKPVPYEKGRGKGFLTKQPSKRAQTVIDAVNLKSKDA